ncbi:MAG: hypothetical protein V6Z89_03470 [Desulfobacter sp.]
MNNRLILTFILGLFLASCAQIPMGAFNSYRDAFTAARTASEAVLTEHEKTEKIQQERKAAFQASQGNPQPPFPEHFDPKKEIENAGKKSGIEERLAAWDVISRYNDALLALAEGQTPTQLSGSFTALGKSLDTFAGSLGASIPGLGPVFSVADTILKVAEQERVRREFNRALKAGEPVVMKIIDFYIDETQYYYGLRRSQTVVAMAGQKRQVRNYAKQMYILSRDYKEPAKDSDEGKSKSAIRKQMAEIMAAVGLPANISTTQNGVKEKWAALEGKGSQPYTRIVDTQLLQFIQAAKSNVAAYQAQEKNLVAYYKALGEYTLVLQKLKTILETLLVSADTPMPLTSTAETVLRTALKVKSQIDALETP